MNAFQLTPAVLNRPSPFQLKPLQEQSQGQRQQRSGQAQGTSQPTATAPIQTSLSAQALAMNAGDQVSFSSKAAASTPVSKTALATTTGTQAVSGQSFQSFLKSAMTQLAPVQTTHAVQPTATTPIEVEFVDPGVRLQPGHHTLQPQEVHFASGFGGFGAVGTRLNMVG
jgi:hypothetical protein